MSNFAIRLGYEFFLEICLCYLIQLSQTNQVKPEVAWIHYVVIGALSVLVLGLCLLLVLRLFKGGPYISEVFEKGSLMSSFWGFRSLSSSIVPVAQVCEAVEYPGE